MLDRETIDVKERDSDTFILLLSVVLQTNVYSTRMILKSSAFYDVNNRDEQVSCWIEIKEKNDQRSKDN